MRWTRQDSNWIACSSACVTHLKHDTLTGKYYLYRKDGSLHGIYTRRSFADRYQYLQSRDGGSSCHPLDIDSAQKNPDSPANACLDGSVVQLTADAPPTCNNQTSIAEGKLDGTKGRLTIDQSSIHSVSGSWSVTKITSFTQSSSFSIGLAIPEGANFGFGFSESTTITNDQTKSFSTSTNDSNAVGLDIDI
ncbi:hypothetical protein BDQ17DRAFT_908922 [Cyathus striatus]|nr:hypothetical protein BDQ17DRAFT_908922 [Cyathus striatus]